MTPEESMTTDPKDAAGEKLRIAIAEKLGWTRREVFSSSFLNPSKEVSRGFAWHNLRDIQQKLPDFLDDPAAALLLVEHMRNEGWYSSHFDHDDGAWTWVFYHTAYGSVSAKAKTFPLAICRAFALANQLSNQ